MKAKTHEFLGMLLWTAEQLSRPTSRNLTDSYESWAYRTGFIRRTHELEKAELIERIPGSRQDRICRLTPKGRMVALGGRDPEARWARQWDGRWRLALFDVPNAQSLRRRRLRDYLRQKDFGCLQKSVWITPDTLEEERATLRGGKTHVQSLVLWEGRPGGGESDAEIVAGAWNFGHINELYTRHGQVLNDRPAGALGKESTAAALLRWAKLEFQSWMDAVTHDPLLPEPLLPAAYLGQRAWRRRIAVLNDAGRQLESFHP